MSLDSLTQRIASGNRKLISIDTNVSRLQNKVDKLYSLNSNLLRDSNNEIHKVYNKVSLSSKHITEIKDNSKVILKIQNTLKENNKSQKEDNKVTTSSIVKMSNLLLKQKNESNRSNVLLERAVENLKKIKRGSSVQKETKRKKKTPTQIKKAQKQKRDQQKLINIQFKSYSYLKSIDRGIKSLKDVLQKSIKSSLTLAEERNKEKTNSRFRFKKQRYKRGNKKASITGLLSYISSLLSTGFKILAFQGLIKSSSNLSAADTTLGQLEKIGIKGSGIALDTSQNLAIKSIDKFFGKSVEKSATKFGEKGIQKIAAEGAKDLAVSGAKLLPKTLGFIGRKVVPFAGLAIGAKFAYDRAKEGDYTGAGLELTSGIASLIPGFGTLASIAIDAFILGRDISKTSKVVTDQQKKLAIDAQQTANILKNAIDIASKSGSEKDKGYVNYIAKFLEIDELRKQQRNLNSNSIKYRNDPNNSLNTASLPKIDMVIKEGLKNNLSGDDLKKYVSSKLTESENKIADDSQEIKRIEIESKLQSSILQLNKILFNNPEFTEKYKKQKDDEERERRKSVIERYKEVSSKIKEKVNITPEQKVKMDKEGEIYSNEDLIPRYYDSSTGLQITDKDVIEQYKQAKEDYEDVQIDEAKNPLLLPALSPNNINDNKDNASNKKTENKPEKLNAVSSSISLNNKSSVIDQTKIANSYEKQKSAIPFVNTNNTNNTVIGNNTVTTPPSSIAYQGNDFTNIGTRN